MSRHAMQEHSLLESGAALVIVTPSMLFVSSLLYGMVESTPVGANDPCLSSDVSVLLESSISVR